MEDFLKALEMVNKAFQPMPQKPKLTPKQFQQKAKVVAKLIQVLSGTETPNGLAKEADKLLEELAKTFIKEAMEKANQASESLPGLPVESDESDQSGDPKA